MSPSVVVRQPSNRPYADAARFAHVIPANRRRPNRQHLSTTLVLLSLSAWSYAMIVAAGALS